MPQDSRTIFAEASAPGKAGVAVFRLSGPACQNLIKTLTKPAALPPPREAALRTIIEPSSGAVIDHGLVLWFPSPASFTGEDVAEFHLHGGKAVKQAFMETLAKQRECRLAEPGEFSRRAFENGKMDLTEAEAIADLVEAETVAQRRQALRQMEGELGRLYNNWAERLTKVLAHIEADIDFSDDDLPEDLLEPSLKEAQKITDEIRAHLDDSHRGERLREGFVVALLGAPNAGKSSLLNALARRDVAIVTSIPGTTRDLIEVHLDLAGYPVTLVDTAGLRESRDAVENEGISRALKKAEQADLKVLVYDGQIWPKRDPKTDELKDGASLSVVNKADLLKEDDPTRSPDKIFVSATHGQGLKELIEKLTSEIDLRFASMGQPTLTRLRHRTALEDCQTHLMRARVAKEAELRAEDLRLAVRALGRITGTVDVEDLLDRIFRDFCIGK